MRYLTFIISLLSLHISAQEVIKDYEFKFQIENTENETLYLANYLGDKLYYFDTAYVDNKGTAVFTGKSIKPGVFAVVTPGPKYFEIIVNEQKIDIETSMDDFSLNMNVIKSEENKAFYEYINYINKRKQESIPLATKYEDSATSSIDKEALKKKIDQIDEDVNNFQNEFSKKYEKLFAPKLMAVNYNVEIPEKIDSKNRYYYYKTHFFERLDLNDDRFARSPAFMKKIETYFTKVLPQIPDSIYLAAFELADKIEDKKSDSWKLIVHYVTNKFEQSKQMGMDKVLVKMGQRFYCSSDSLAYWMPQDKLKNLCEKVDIIEHLLIGEKAPNLILQDTTEKHWVNLHQDMKSKWTVLAFWDPECGHCKEEIPLINDLYRKLKDSMDISIVGVCGVLETDKWKKFILENELTDWIHISDNPEIHNNAYKYFNQTTLESLNFRQTYDIYSYPQIYLLDENKVIRAKKIGAENIEKVLLQLSKQAN